MRRAQAARRMHIAMVTETYPPEVNGVARTVALMAAGLRALGHTIELVRPRQGEADAPLARHERGDARQRGVLQQQEAVTLEQRGDFGEPGLRHARADQR